MKIYLHLSNEKTKNLTDGAEQQLELLLKKYANDLLDEATRIEIANRTKGVKPEITGTFISEANNFQRYYKYTKSKSKSLKILDITRMVFTLLTGWFFDFDNFSNYRYTIFMVILITVTVVLNTYLYFNE